MYRRGVKHDRNFIPRTYTLSTEIVNALNETCKRMNLSYSVGVETAIRAWVSDLKAKLEGQIKNER